VVAKRRMEKARIGVALMLGLMEKASGKSKD
jgi:hypothetical protein